MENNKSSSNHMNISSDLLATETQQLNATNIQKHIDDINQNNKLLLENNKESKEDIDIFTAIKQVVNNCIVTPNTNVNDFTIFDLEYIFLISSTSRKTTIPFYKPRAMYRSC
jgi:hypothetical protein